MRVVHLSTFADHGGAGRAALRIHRGLRSLGVDSSMLVAEASTPTQHIRIARRATDDLHRRRMTEMAFAMAPYARTRPKGLELFSTDRSPYGPELVEQLDGADVVHLHWVARFVDIGPVLEALPPNASIVWTLHDMNVFTGGCHYDRGCGRFVDACGACPQLGSTTDADLSRAVHERKRAAFGRIAPQRLRFVAVSRWLADLASSSPALADHTVDAIHGAVDTDVFRPTDPVEARRALGLPIDARLVLFVAATPDLDRKGFSNALLDERWTLVTVGPSQRPPPPGAIALGAIREDERLALAYAAADVTVIPSAQEAFGLTAIESMACGTPVVAHPVGGLREVVHDGRTGRLVSPSEVPDAIGLLLEETLEARRQMAEAARAYAFETFGIETIARRYREIYGDTRNLEE